MQYLRVKNWEEFQHYKDRNPPWIKLHTELLNNYKFTCLQDASKLHLMLIWLLASQMDNKLPNDPEWIQHRLHLEEVPDINLFIKHGFMIVDSNALAESKQDASNLLPRGEERRGETEEKTHSKKTTKSNRFTPPTARQVKDYARSINFSLDGESFVNFYESKGWMVGKNKMKSWEAAVRTWKSKNKTDQPENNSPYAGVKG